MIKIKLLAVAGTLALGTLTLTGCTMFDDVSKDWESDTVGLHRVATVYSKTGEVLKTYEGNNMRVATDDSGLIRLNVDGKRVQIHNADIIVEEK